MLPAIGRKRKEILCRSIEEDGPSRAEALRGPSTLRRKAWLHARPWARCGGPWGSALCVAEWRCGLSARSRGWCRGPWASGHALLAWVGTKQSEGGCACTRPERPSALPSSGRRGPGPAHLAVGLLLLHAAQHGRVHGVHLGLDARRLLQHILRATQVCTHARSICTVGWGSLIKVLHAASCSQGALRAARSAARE